MIKYICDICRQEKEIRHTCLPSLNANGRKERGQGRQIMNFSCVDVAEFDLCEECLGELATLIYEKSGRIVIEED